MRKKVYAIIGEKRVGKDTAADHICEVLGYKKYALATPLKELVCKLFGITMEQLDQWKNEKWNLHAQRSPFYSDVHEVIDLDVSFRSVLQICGDMQKAFFGLDCYMQKFTERTRGHDKVAVPDTRLVEEQHWFDGNPDIEVVYIKVVKDVKKDADSAHRTESEAHLLHYNFLVDNNGTLEEFKEKLNNIIK